MATFAPSNTGPTANKYETHISILNNVIEQGFVDPKDALTVASKAATVAPLKEISELHKQTKTMMDMVANIAAQASGGGASGGG